MRRFESSRPSQAFRGSENFLFLMRKARQTRASIITQSLQRLTFALFRPRILESLQSNRENSRFLETRTGDPRINTLRGRGGSRSQRPSVAADTRYRPKQRLRTDKVSKRYLISTSDAREPDPYREFESLSVRQHVIEVGEKTRALGLFVVLLQLVADAKYHD